MDVDVQLLIRCCCCFLKDIITGCFPGVKIINLQLYVWYC